MHSDLSSNEALIYVMVTMSAVDREMSDRELRRIGGLVQTLPVFQGFDPDQLLPVAQKCGERLSEDDGLDQVLTAIAEALPERLYETAYAVAVEVAAVDLNVAQEELRFLQMLRDRLELDKLVCAAIERSARARYRTA